MKMKSSVRATSEARSHGGPKRAGHDVRSVGNDKAAIRDTAGWVEEVVVLAAPVGALDGIVKSADKQLSGKP
jgi:hypothetical protein